MKRKILRNILKGNRPNRVLHTIWKEFQNKRYGFLSERLRNVHPKRRRGWEIGRGQTNDLYY